MGITIFGAVYRTGFFSMHASKCRAARLTLIMNGLTSPFAILVSTNPKRTFDTFTPFGHHRNHQRCGLHHSQKVHTENLCLLVHISQIQHFADPGTEQAQIHRRFFLQNRLCFFLFLIIGKFFFFLPGADRGFSAFQWFFGDFDWTLRACDFFPGD